MKKDSSIIPTERVIQKIFLIRGKKVMFDKDLAFLYSVETKRLNEAVKRNKDRFPADFMFQLNEKETKIWEQEILRSQIATSRSQSVISSFKHGGRRSSPYVFTEQGVAMLSSVLNSKRAIQVNIQIIRTFTKLREILSTHRELAVKIEQMEKKYDKNIAEILNIISHLLKEEPKSKEKIGFNTK